MKRIIAFMLSTVAAFTMMIGAAGASNYSDVSDTAWYSTAINAISPGYMNGYEDGTFRPNNYITRAEAAAILDRAMVPAQYGGEIIFNDVPYDAWYFKAASWNGLFIGGTDMYPNGSTPLGYTAYFYPNDYITREDVAVGIYNRALSTGLVDYSAFPSVTTYVDRNQISPNDPNNEYPYEKAFAVLNQLGVMTGNPDGTINPKGHLTRAEMATIMYNLLD